MKFRYVRRSAFNDISLVVMIAAANRAPFVIGILAFPSTGDLDTFRLTIESPMHEFITVEELHAKHSII